MFVTHINRSIDDASTKKKFSKAPPYVCHIIDTTLSMSIFYKGIPL